jgi:hypothetical protein
MYKLWKYYCPTTGARAARQGAVRDLPTVSIIRRQRTYRARHEILGQIGSTHWLVGCFTPSRYAQDHSIRQIPFNLLYFQATINL